MITITTTGATSGDLTVGSVVPLTGNCVDYSYWYWPTYQWPTEPQACIGKAHVFECDHVKKCKCGAVERVMKGKKCKSDR